MNGLALFVILLTAPQANAHSTGDVPPSAELANSTTVDRGSDEFTLPAVQLTVPAGYENEAAYMAATRRSVQEMADRAANESDDLTRIRLLLSTVNLILAHEIEPACTRMLLQIRQDGALPVATTEPLDRADTMLGMVRELTNAHDIEDNEAEAWADLRAAYETLNAFSGALRAYLSGAEGADGMAATRESASRLSVLLEDDSPQIASAAAFWQACLRAKEGRSKRALSMLDRALSQPSPEKMPYAMFGRLLRCRLIAAGQGYATSLALLTQMESMASDWFTDEGVEGDTSRTITLTMLQTLASWGGRFSAEQAPERQWCVDQFKEMRKGAFESANTVIRLNPAVPFVVSPKGVAKKKPSASP